MNASTPFFDIISGMKRLTVFLPLIAALGFSATAETSSTNMIQIVKPSATNTVGAIKKPLSRPAKITADKSFYDRKEGIATFIGRVYVDDEKYQIHADKAYVSIVPTNQLRRIVAIGGVAMTNEMRRAYGEKVTYNRPTGTVVLTGSSTSPAMIVDEAKGEGRHQVVKGSKIRFWIGAEQVEVLDAQISTPASGMGAVKDAVGGGL